jgi:hypothetical protein
MSAAPETRRATERPLPGGDFRLFVQRLGYQALIALGLVENPVTGRKGRNMPHARATLDDLEMLRAKTAGNLQPAERAHLEELLANLRAAVERAERAAPPSDENGGESDGDPAGGDAGDDPDGG